VENLREGGRRRVKGDTREKGNSKANKRGENIMFCVNNKDKDFWNYVGKFDFVSLCEIWLQENEWKKIEERLSNSHKWECIYAHREKKRGRTIEGFIVGVKKNWAQESNLIYKNKEGVIISIREKKVVIISVYNRGSWKNLEEKLESILGDMENEEIIIINGDFNVRTGELDNVE